MEADELRVPRDTLEVRAELATSENKRLLSEARYEVEQRLQVERESHLAAQKRVLDAEAAKRAAALEARLRAQLAQAEKLAAARDETVALLRHKLGVSEDNVRQLHAELQQRSWQRAEEISAQTDAHAQALAAVRAETESHREAEGFCRAQLKCALHELANLEHERRLAHLQAVAARAESGSGAEETVRLRLEVDQLRTLTANVKAQLQQARSPEHSSFAR